MVRRQFLTNIEVLC